MMAAVNEYIVTLKQHCDLDIFYQDMETAGGNSHVPQRAVECCCRRPQSRNTHYDLTEEEAAQLLNDARVLAVELTPEQRGLVIRSNFTQTETTWNKSSTQNSTHKNWALLRSVAGSQISNWGSNGTVSQSATIQVNAEGKNVDVIIVDGMIDPAHPELAVNSNGTGGSRVIQYNWFQHSVSVEGTVKNSYVYTPYVDVAPTGQTFVFQNPGFAYTINGFDGTNPAITLVRGVTYTFNFQSVTSGHPIALRLSNGNTSAVPGTTGNNPSGGVWGSSATVTYAVPLDAPASIRYQCVFHSSMIGTINIVDNTFDPDRTDDNNHGAHVAGTACGNTQGWARSANVYNINPYGTDVNGISGTLLIDYIRAFHAAKSVNPATGRKNPTICNHSWGYSYSPVAISSITSVVWQGITYTGPFTAGQLNDYGIFTADIDGTVSAISPVRVTAVDADMEDAILDGIIMVGAAGNGSNKIDVPGGTDFDNRFLATTNYRYHEGMSPTAAVGCICVGAVSSLVNETKAIFSACGPRVDIYAPGVNIISSLNTILGNWPGADDPRNATYKIGKSQGTSMASPQVCGVLACALEIYPNLAPAQALAYLVAYSKQDQMTNTAGTYTDLTSLQGSQNRYLFYFKERKDSGSVFPKTNHLLRYASKQAYPRPRIRRSA